MSGFKIPTGRVRIIFTLVIAVLLAGGLALTPSFAEPPPSASTNSISPAAAFAPARPSPTNSVKVAVKHQLTGAELYSINCNRCHPERAPTDWTGAQWKTIMLQMQVRANIPAKQAKLILQYLQENSGR